jgi:hypothetical protein
VEDAMLAMPTAVDSTADTIESSDWPTFSESSAPSWTRCVDSLMRCVISLAA